MAPSAVSVQSFSALSEDHRTGVEQALTEAEAADGVDPLSEDAWLRLRPGTPDVTHLVTTDGGVVTGYAQLDHSDPAEGGAELFVTPAHRRAGRGRALGRALLELSPALSMWAHGDLPGSAELAQDLGLTRSRDLWQMRAALESGPPPTLPDDVRIRTFVPGRDDEDWLRLNATAFASHPEQGGWTAQDLQQRLGEPWFDPAGFFVAERDGRLVGFHWTKVHPPTAAEPEPLGEIYVLGVDPAEAGRGLGSLLTAVGLHSLQQRGLRTVLLYVEATNPAAIRVYERHGFARYSVDVGYRHVAR